MSNTQKIFEAVLVILGMIGIAIWLYVMITLAGAPPSTERVPFDCVLPSGDSC